MFSDKEEIIENCRLVEKVLSDCSEIDKELQEKKQELEVIIELIRKCVDDNSKSEISKEEFEKRHNSLVEKFEIIRDSIDNINRMRKERLAKGTKIKGFIKAME